MQRVIFRMPNWIGDLVMATPLLSDWKRHFPTGHLSVLCRPPLGELLESDPRVNEVLSLSDATRHRLLQKHYDVGILLPHSFSSAWLFYRAHIPKRVGYKRDLRSMLLTERLSFPKQPEHQVDQYKRVLEPFGIPRSSTPPHLTATREEGDDLLRAWGLPAGAPWVAIHPGATFGSAKCWLPERFRALALRFLEESETFVLFLGNRAAQSLSSQICQGLSHRVIDLTGQTSLRQLVSLLKQCPLLITNDSGPMHIGAALRTPMVALFGSTDPTRTGPYATPHTAVLYHPPLCSPCFQRICPIDFRCMKAISVEEVWQQGQRLLTSRATIDACR